MYMTEDEVRYLQNKSCQRDSWGMVKEGVMTLQGWSVSAKPNAEARSWKRVLMNYSCRESSVTRPEQHHFLTFTQFPANMAVAVDDGQFLKQATGRSTRGLLRVIILCLIAGAAVSSRLFSVIRFESIIHEC